MLLIIYVLLVFFQFILDLCLQNFIYLGIEVGKILSLVFGQVSLECGYKLKMYSSYIRVLFMGGFEKFRKGNFFSGQIFRQYICLFILFRSRGQNIYWFVNMVNSLIYYLGNWRKIGRFGDKEVLDISM